jgi:hypothetical protein
MSPGSSGSLLLLGGKILFKGWQRLSQSWWQYTVHFIYELRVLAPFPFKVILCVGANRQNFIPNLDMLVSMMHHFIHEQMLLYIDGTNNFNRAVRINDNVTRIGIDEWGIGFGRLDFPPSFDSSASQNLPESALWL